MNNKLKGVGTAGLAILSTIPFSNDANATTRPIPSYIQAKIDSAKAVEPLGLYDIMTATNPFANAPLIESDSTQTGFSQLETFLEKYVGVDDVGMFVKVADEETARKDFFDKDWQESINTPYRFNDITTTLNAIILPMSATSPKNQEGTSTHFIRNELRQDWQTRPAENQNKAERIANYNLELNPDFNPDIVEPGQRIYLPADLQDRFYNIRDRLVEIAGVPDVTQQLIDEMERSKDDKSREIESLESSINRAGLVIDRQSDVIEKQGYFLSNWSVEPYAGVTAFNNEGENLKELGNYTIGLRATTPNRIGLLAEYTPELTSTENTHFETREDIPSNRPISGEVVRETNVEDQTTRYRVAGGMDFPVSNRMNLGVMLGMQSNKLESNWTDNSYTLRNGQKYNEQQDNFKQTDSSKDLLIGANTNMKVSDLLSLYAQGMYNVETGNVNGTLGLRFNIAGGRK